MEYPGPQREVRRWVWGGHKGRTDVAKQQGGEDLSEAWVSSGNI